MLTSKTSCDYGADWEGKSLPLLFNPLSRLLSSSLPTSVTDSIEGSGPASREGGETGVKMVQQANLTLANQPCCSSPIHVESAALIPYEKQLRRFEVERALTSPVSSDKCKDGAEGAETEMGEGSGREGGKGCSADYIASRASQNNRGYEDMLDTVRWRESNWKDTRPILNHKKLENKKNKVLWMKTMFWMNKEKARAH